MSLHHKKLGRRKWAALRLQMLDIGGWRCVVCGKYANEVDHINPLDRGGDPYDETNLQVLCSGPGGCHATKTRIENGRVRTPAEMAWDIYVDELAAS